MLCLQVGGAVGLFPPYAHWLWWVCALYIMLVVDWPEGRTFVYVKVIGREAKGKGKGIESQAGMSMQYPKVWRAASAP